VKKELGVPGEYALVAPIIVGYPQGKVAQLTRDAPEILSWKDKRKRPHLRPLLIFTGE
jgi:hypothetical protein